MEDSVLSVSDFVAVLNQTLEYAYPAVLLQGELANFRISKNKWVYFDLKDDYASVRFFGTVYQLPGPLEDGMMLQVRGTPRLHQLYGFSVTVQTMQPLGEGSLKKAAALLQAKLQAEGLFDDSRKRPIPYIPKKVGLVTSDESAAYHDFIKILDERWRGVQVYLADVQVQGDIAPGQIVRAIEYFSTHTDVDVVVVTRGGGSADDLAAFSTEHVTRAIAGSRIPTIVAIGHEVDISLAELAADRRASTPSNAAQMLVPDMTQELQRIASYKSAFGQALSGQVVRGRHQLQIYRASLQDSLMALLQSRQERLALQRQLLQALSPTRTLDRGFAVVSKAGKTIVSAKQLKPGDAVTIRFKDAHKKAKIS